MNRSLMGALLLVTLAGCSQQGDGRPARLAADGAAQESATQESAAQDSATQDSANKPATARRTLAYRHTIALDVAEDKVAQVFEAGQAACRAMTAAVCTVMNAQLNSDAKGRMARATRHRPS